MTFLFIMATMFRERRYFQPQVPMSGGGGGGGAEDVDYIKWCDILICNLWMEGTYSIHDMHVSNTYSPSYYLQYTSKVIAVFGRDNNNNCLDLFLEQQRNFYPFLFSSDRLLGDKAEARIKRLMGRLLSKWKQP